MSSNIPLVTGSYPALPTGFTKVDYAVTWNIQVAFCKIIGQFDSGPPMLEEPQSPALLRCSPSTPQLAYLGLDGLDMLPVGKPPFGGRPPAAALHFGIVQDPLEVPHAVVLAPFPAASSCDFRSICRRASGGLELYR